MLDLLIENGLIVDGTGNPGYYGSIGIDGDRVWVFRGSLRLSLPDAIRKMTSFPAQKLGLQDRGILRDGMAADITVFDPGSVKAPATRTNPKQFPIGIEYVIVNGELVVEQGQHTGALPGRAIKRR